MNKAAWGQWLGATVVAGVTASFVLLTYIHASFLPVLSFSDHQKTVHSGAVQLDTCIEDLRDLRTRADVNSRKLDRVIELIIESKGTR